ncbi:hypothetical protein F3N42_08480 [Marinihelvus fidelis]|uniref:DUF2628 domain-containing protein n=1 Tax=Marinihelvus fidelis TaxID=2613842 RepID=A0A5N0TDH5_9GAMM|nr:hypothetical protein [Marinihelvus fidelis]KAA9131349.1 hypothetical protein F3N42_08480 [Marinihelvus fidelis]
MHIYDIYRHPDYGYQAVRRGFSWQAFLLPSVWAVRRGLGYITLVLVIATSLAFDIAELLGQWAGHPVSQVMILVALSVVVGLKPGFDGYRWHARALKDDDFRFQCSVAASSRRKAIRAAAGEQPFAGAVNVAA